MIRSLIRPLFLVGLCLEVTACAPFGPPIPALQVPVQEGSPAFAYRQVSEHLTATQQDYRIIRLVAGQKGATELPTGNRNWRVWLYSANENKAYIANSAPGQAVAIEPAPAELSAGSGAIEVSRWRIDSDAARAAARQAGFEDVHGLALHSAEDLKTLAGIDSADPAWAVRWNSSFIYINANTGATL